MNTITQHEHTTICNSIGFRKDGIVNRIISTVIIYSTSRFCLYQIDSETIGIICYYLYIGGNSHDTNHTSSKFNVFQD